jgi:pyroglutamyl-peptidase
MVRVLLTSFEPFGRYGLNSSLEAGREVSRVPPPGVELDWLLLPVVAWDCVERAWERVCRVRPDVVLALGQAAGTPVLRVEEWATNLDDFPIPDNAGVQVLRQPVVPGGPARYRATWDLAHVRDRLCAGGLPAAVSPSAGSYVCNHLYYGLLHRADVGGWTHQTGFLHLPLLAGQALPRQKIPTWPLAPLVAGVRQAILACAERARA